MLIAASATVLSLGLQIRHGEHDARITGTTQLEQPPREGTRTRNVNGISERFDLTSSNVKMTGLNIFGQYCDRRCHGADGQGSIAWHDDDKSERMLKYSVNLVQKGMLCYLYYE